MGAKAPFDCGEGYAALKGRSSTERVASWMSGRTILLHLRVASWCEDSILHRSFQTFSKRGYAKGPGAALSTFSMTDRHE